MHLEGLGTRRLSVLASLIFVFVVAAYLPVLRNDFVALDDPLLITQNAAIQQFNGATLRHDFSSYDPELYVPLTTLSYQVNHLIGGLHPSVYHLTNILLHALSSVLVFGIALFLLQGDVFAALAVALLFALHPIQVEAVAWASARKDVLSGFFFLLSLWLFQRSQESDHEWPIGSLIAFFLGLLSKVTVAILPLVLILSLWRERRLSGRGLRKIVPYAVLSVIFIIIAIFGKQQNLSSLSIYTQALLFCKGVTFTLIHLASPLHLSVLYEQVTPVTLRSWEFAAPVLVVLLLALMFVLALRRGHRDLAFGIGFFLLALLPLVGTFVRNHMTFFASDRYAYIASLGVFFLVGVAVQRLRLLFGTRMASLGCTAFFLILTALTVWQETTWKDTELMYRNVLRVGPSAVAEANLGVVLLQKKLPAEAKEHFEQSVALNPQYPWAYVRLSSIEEQNGNASGALALLHKATERMDQWPILAEEDLVPYYSLGEFLMARGQGSEGLTVFEHAVARAPERAEPHYNLGIKYQQVGRIAQATQEFEKAVALQPYFPAALYHLAGVYGEQGMLNQAMETLQRLVAIAPAYEKAAEHLRQIEQILQTVPR